MPTSKKPLRKLVSRSWMDALNRKRRRPDKDRDAGGVPVEPDRPRDLSGGAAAALDFEGE